MAHIGTASLTGPEPVPPAAEAPLERVRRLAAAARRSAEVHAAAMRSRNDAMLDAHEGGYSDGAIAKVSGIRRQSVMAAVLEAQAARAAEPQEGTA